MGYWKDQRIWVTGGTGFLGSMVTQQLKEQKCQEIFSTGTLDGDLTNLTTIRRMLSIFRPTIIIHLAAKVGGIGANRERPADFLYQNLIMGTQLLHEAYVHKVSKMVIVGTVCAYPQYTPVPFHEDDLWNGYPEPTNAPYGIAKKILLVQAQAYREQCGFNAIYLLPTNLFGPGDNFNPDTSHVIPALIKKCVQAKRDNLDQIVVWGDGSPTREFLYVNDAAQGIILATEHYNQADPVNLGSGYEISIQDLVQKITAIVGFHGKIVFDTTMPNGQLRRCLDTTRAKAAFRFEATTPFDKGLRETIEWYLKHEK